MGDTSQSAYSGGGLRKPSVMPGADPNQDDPTNPGRRTNPQLTAQNLVSVAPPPAIAPGAPPPATGMPGAPPPAPPASSATPPNSAPPPAGGGYTTMTDKDGNAVGHAGGVPGTGYGPRATKAPPGAAYSHVDGQGNPTGVATIGGMQRVRSGSWWLDKKLVDQYGENDDRAQVGRIEYSQGLNQMAAASGAAARAAKTTATGYDSEAARKARSDAANSIGVNWKSDENQDDPVFVARQVLAEELYNGGMYLLPNSNLAFAYHGDLSQGDAGWKFKDKSTGAEVQPTPEQLALAKSIGDGGGSAGGNPPAGPAGASNAVDVNGLPLAPGAPAYGMPGAQYGWQTQARDQSNYPYLAKGAVAMPGSSKGVPVIMAEAGEPEVAIPVSKLRRAVGDQAAQKVVAAVSDRVLMPGGSRDVAARPHLAAGALTMGAEGQAGSAAPNPNYAPPPQGPPGPTSGSGTPNYSPHGPWDGTLPYGAGTNYTPGPAYMPGHYTPYQQRDMSDQEKAQLASISGIARAMTGQGQNLYSIGAPAYAQAVKYYQTLLGGNRVAMQAATAGSAEAIRAQGRGLDTRITASLGRSGAADTLKAQSANEEAAAIAHLTQGVQPAAAAALQSAGLEGANAGASMEAQGGDFYSKIQQSLTQSRQFEENLSESSRQFGANYDEQSRQFGTQLAQNDRQYASSLAEQVRQGNMSYAQAMKALELNDAQFKATFDANTRSFDESVRQFNESLKVQTQGIKTQKSGQKGAAIASGIGTAAMIIIAI